MLSVSGLGAWRGSARVASGVDFDARAGEIIAIVGPNGAGKTSILEAVCGLLPRSGDVAFRGEALVTFSDHARVFSFMPDETIAAEELCVRDVAPLDLSRALGLADAPMASLSRGEKKRVDLAVAIGAARPITLLDEPFGAFDPLQLDRVVAVIRERTDDQHAFLCSIHQLADAERIADRVLLVARGRALAFGTLAELRDKAGVGDEATLERVFRTLVTDAA